jgi:hypothetical protein
MRPLCLLTLLSALSLSACGDEGNDADRLGVGAECTETADCPEVQIAGDAGIQQLECLPDFKGGYCGLVNCVDSLGCPDGSLCVAHTDGENYCFRTCADKAECNLRRGAGNESNCSSSFDLADPAEPKTLKACIPPSA